MVIRNLLRKSANANANAEGSLNSKQSRFCQDWSATFEDIVTLCPVKQSFGHAVLGVQLECSGVDLDDPFCHSSFLAAMSHHDLRRFAMLLCLSITQSNRWAMQHGKTIIPEAHTAIKYAKSYVILLTSRLLQSPAQCLHCSVFDECF